MTDSFLSFTVRLPEGLKEDISQLEDVIPYDGSKKEHKILHITIVGPRKSFDVNDWKEKIQEKVTKKPTKFKIGAFESLWSSSKVGFKGKLNGKTDVDNPHVVLFDCKSQDKAERYWNDNKEVFEKYEGKELKIKSIAVIEKNEGIVYEEEITKDSLDFDIEQGPPFEQDLEDVKAFFDFLDHSETTVYQVFKKNGSASQQRFIESVDEVLDVIKDNKLEGLNCFGINGRKEGHTTIEDGISKINVILFDIDIKKQVKKAGVSPKKHIKEAYGVAQNVRDKLKDLGFETDIVNFSGNGLHLGIKADIDLPRYNSKEEWKESLYYRKLETLEDKLSGLETENVEIDSITKDIIRRVKIPGTYNVKEEIAKKNYRRASIIYLNDDIDEERNNEAFQELEAKKRKRDVSSKKRETETGNKEGRPSFDKLIELVREGKIEDSKLEDLYQGNWEGYGYDSRSEAEQALVNKLVFYGYDDFEIKNIMDTCGIGKWDEKGDSYKDATIDYAKEKQIDRADWDKDYNEIKIGLADLSEAESEDGSEEESKEYEEKELTEITVEEDKKLVKAEGRIHKIKERPNVIKRKWKCNNCNQFYQTTEPRPWVGPPKPKNCDCGDPSFYKVKEKTIHGFLLKTTEPNKLPTEQTRKVNVWVSLEDIDLDSSKNGKKTIASILENFGADVEIKGQAFWKMDWKRNGEIKNTKLWLIAQEVNRSEKDLEMVEITEEDKDKFRELFRPNQEDIELTKELRQEYKDKLMANGKEEVEDEDIKREIKKERERDLYNEYIARGTVGREKLKRNSAYVMATPVELEKEGDTVLDYGDGRMMVFGDPGESKSQSAKRFLNSTLEEIGAEKITAEYLSIAGLGGSVKKSNDGFWTIDWGIFPYVNRKGLVLDGIHQFSKKWLSKMREMIEERKVKIIKSAKGEAECSARIIGISNTNEAPISESYATNYQASFDLGIGTEDERDKFKGPDRRRWDILWPVNKEDVDPSKVDEHILDNIGSSEAKRDLKTWKKLWAWIWNLEYEDYDWNKVQEFKDEIKEKLDGWRHQYPGAELAILGKKGSKIFTSYLIASASLHYRLNEEGKVSPTRKDFENVVFLFEDMFDKLEMDKWKMKKKGKMTIATEIYTQIEDVIQGNVDEDMLAQVDTQENFRDIKKIIKEIGQNPTKPLKDVAKDLNMGKMTLYRRLGEEIDLCLPNHEIEDYSFKEGYIDEMVDIEPCVKNGKLTKLGKAVFTLIKKEG